MYPLNCIDETGDGFSGWFAISNPNKCNDFCYWDVPPSPAPSSSSDGNATTEEQYYAAWNTADPHGKTVVVTPSGSAAYWTCVYDGADDKTLVDVEGERWIDSWGKYSPGLPRNDIFDEQGVPFPYLRCQKGAGERLKTVPGSMVKSAPFWGTWIFIACLVYVGEMVMFYVYYKRGRILPSILWGKYEEVEQEVGDVDRPELPELETSFHTAFMGDTNDEAVTSTNGEEVNHMSEVQMQNGTAIGNNNLQDTDEGGSILTSSSFTRREEFTQRIATRCKCVAPLTHCRCNPKHLKRCHVTLKILLLLAINVILACTLFVSIISLREINTTHPYTEEMQKWTPKCLNPDAVCPAGNADIRRESYDVYQSHQQQPHFDSERRSGGTDSPPTMKPFSYILASDAQLYWFNGEFAEMGRLSFPPACSSSDSCGQCTGKHGASTNRRLKKAWERLMSGAIVTNTSGIDGDLPVPKTLVMNGDLAAYFHPHELHAYESIYGNIEGLEYYWPSLGNHDMEHMSGAMFGGDEWVGLPNCNAEHALGYIKSGFCGAIPGFETGRIWQFDAASLSYSWNEGGYHFVHTHYYPSYEMASMNYRSSLGWLERDLQMAHDAGLVTILFVHAAQGLNPALENVILGKNVKAIIAGHTHRCLHRRCEGAYPLHESQVSKISAEKCAPAGWDTCEVLNGMNLIYTKDMVDNVTLPKNELHNRDDKPDKPLCPQPTPFFINDTDNSLLCRKVIWSERSFPFEREGDSTESIPIFWSGSASFETFLRGDFYEDKIVLNAMTLKQDGDAARYVDLHTVPNAAYPFHSQGDLDEVIIYLN